MHNNASDFERRRNAESPERRLRYLLDLNPARVPLLPLPPTPGARWLRVHRLALSVRRQFRGKRTTPGEKSEFSGFRISIQSTYVPVRKSVLLGDVSVHEPRRRSRARGRGGAQGHAAGHACKGTRSGRRLSAVWLAIAHIYHRRGGGCIGEGMHLNAFDDFVVL